MLNQFSVVRNEVICLMLASTRLMRLLRKVLKVFKFCTARRTVVLCNTRHVY